MSRRKKNGKSVIQKHTPNPRGSEERSSFSQEIIDDDFGIEKSKNDNTTQEIMDRMNRKTLSSILARIAALENENKTLKAKANKEAMVSRGKNMISDKSFVGKNT